MGASVEAQQCPDNSGNQEGRTRLRMGRLSHPKRDCLILGPVQRVQTNGLLLRQTVHEANVLQMWPSIVGLEHSVDWHIH